VRNLTIIFLLLPLLSFAWSKDSLNRVDTKGKKDGYWKVFLDSQLFVTDSAQSHFYGYDLYDHGHEVFRYSNRGRWKWAQITYEDTLPVKGKPIEITGTFLWYSSDSLLWNTEIYSEGSPWFWEANHYLKGGKRPSGFERIYFYKHFENTEGTFLVAENFSHGETRYYWYIKGDKKWYSKRIEGPFDPDQAK
jgi:hypothetical protein